MCDFCRSCQVGRVGEAKGKRQGKEWTQLWVLLALLGVTAQWASYMHLFAQETAQKEYVACAPWPLLAINLLVVIARK